MIVYGGICGKHKVVLVGLNDKDAVNDAHTLAPSR